MLSKDEVCSLLSERKLEMQQLYGVNRMGLCGSYARGEQQEYSDIDIVVELESANVFRSFFGLKRYLEDMLEKKVDLGIEHAIKPAVRNQMLKDIHYV